MDPSESPVCGGWRLVLSFQNAGSFTLSDKLHYGMLLDILAVPPLYLFCNRFMSICLRLSLFE